MNDVIHFFVIGNVSVIHSCSNATSLGLLLIFEVCAKLRLFRDAAYILIAPRNTVFLFGK